jgi:hypothetical protein
VSKLKAMLDDADVRRRVLAVAKNGANSKGIAHRPRSHQTNQASGTSKSTDGRFLHTIRRRRTRFLRAIVVHRNLGFQTFLIYDGETQELAYSMHVTVALAADK